MNSLPTELVNLVHFYALPSPFDHNLELKTEIHSSMDPTVRSHRMIRSAKLESRRYVRQRVREKLKRLMT